jgi:hypothetical protein
MRSCILFFLVFNSIFNVYGQANYFSGKGTADFRSEAQQELIKATSTELIGVLNPAGKTFFFKVQVQTFQGFNSALQQEHFNEKYLESDKYPEATFYGKIIENIDLAIDGLYDIRAKGILKIHGVEMERIIRNEVKVENGIIKIKSSFSVLLSDHKIKVPRVVHEKIASEILVDINIELSKNQGL